MSSRFNSIQQDRYMPTYTSLPLEAISNLAKDYSGRYQQGQQNLDELGELSSRVNAIDQHQQYKQELLNHYNNRINDLATRYSKGEDINNLNREASKLKRDFVSDPIRNELETSYSNYNAYQKDKIAKGDKYGEHYDNYLGFKGSTQNNGINPYRYTGMGEIQDHQKLAIDMMSGIKESGKEYDNVGLDSNGNIIGHKGGSKYILNDRVRDLANGKVGSFLVTKEGQDFAKMLKYNNPNININKAAEEYLYQAGANQIHSINSSGNDFKYAPKYINDGLKPKEVNPKPLNQTVEGLPIDLTSPEFKDLKDKGIIDDKGQVDFLHLIKPDVVKNVNKEAGDRIANMNGWLNLNLSSNQGSNTKNAEQLVKVVQQAASVLGYDPKTIKANDFNKVLNEYNSMITTKGYMGNQLTAAEKDINTKQVLTDATNYEFLDDKLQLSNKATDNKASIYNKENQFNINNRVNIDGKSYLQGTIIDKESGKTETVYVRPKTKEYNQYFDAPAQVAKSMQDYYTGKTKPKSADDPAFNGTNILSETVTNGGKSIIRVYKNPTDPNNNEQVVQYDIKYVPSEIKGKYNTQLSNRTVLGNSFKEYQQGVHAAYGDTPEGLKMYENQAPKKTQFELETEE